MLVGHPDGEIDLDAAIHRTLGVRGRDGVQERARGMFAASRVLLRPRPIA